MSRKSDPVLELWLPRPAAPLCSFLLVCVGESCQRTSPAARPEQSEAIEASLCRSPPRSLLASRVKGSGLASALHRSSPRSAAWTSTSRHRSRPSTLALRPPRLPPPPTSPHQSPSRPRPSRLIRRPRARARLPPSPCQSSGLSPASARRPTTSPPSPSSSAQPGRSALSSSPSTPRAGSPGRPRPSRAMCSTSRRASGTPRRTARNSASTSRAGASSTSPSSSSRPCTTRASSLYPVRPSFAPSHLVSGALTSSPVPSTSLPPRQRPALPRRPRRRHPRACPRGRLPSC